MADKPQPTIEELQAALAAANQAASAAREDAARANGERMMARATLDAIQATQDLLDAKRELALGNDDDDHETEAEIVSEIHRTNTLLRAQPKFTIEIPIAPDEEGKNPFSVAQINGALLYQIAHGELVEVPESVYQVLVASHVRVRPQRKQDYGLVPQRLKPGMQGPATSDQQ